MDWSTVVILAGVTWLDGLRRVPAGALVLRRVFAGQWRVADRETEPGLRLVSWWNPFSLALIIPSGGISATDSSRQQTDDALAARLAGMRRVVTALRVLGALVIVDIVFGIPAAIARFDAWGLGISLAAVLLLAATIAAIVSCTMRRAGHSWRRATRIGAPLLYPFSAPRAAEVVLLESIAGAAPLMVARRLLGPTSFAAWVRPQAYDALRDVSANGSASLVAGIGHADLAAIVQTPPLQCAADECYCPRCARVYRAGIVTCAECAGLRLVPSA